MIVPISIPNINWHGFVKTTVDATGLSPTRPLDTAGVKPGDLKSFLQALAVFDDRNVSIHSCLATNNYILAHAYITLLAEVSEYDVPAILSACSNLEMMRADSLHERSYLYLITANLYEWKTAVSKGLAPSQRDNVRKFFTEVLTIFDKAGLSDLWRGYTRTVKAGMVQLSYT